MTANEYTRSLLEVVENHAEQISDRFQHVINHLPEQAHAIHLHVFIDQDGEGFVGIRVSLDGPDLYNLQRGIQDCAELFQVTMTESGFEPPVPYGLVIDGAGDSRELSVDTLIPWLAQLLEERQLLPAPLRVEILNPDGYGNEHIGMAPR